ncbi:MAG: hypothetical protein KBA66_00370 [Leptospiraceae bacterium]|nr:hypothetical protein [Leptospiraceae bacterium]
MYSEEIVKKESKYNISTGYKFMSFGSGYDERLFNGGFTNFAFAFKNDSEFYFGAYSIVSSLKEDLYSSFPYTKSDFYAFSNFGSSFGIQKKKKYDAPAYFYAGMNFKFKPDSPSLSHYIGISLGRFPGETYEECKLLLLASE